MEWLWFAFLFFVIADFWTKSFIHLFQTQIKNMLFHIYMKKTLIRLSMTQPNLFAMIPIPWCVRYIHVSNEHKVFCHCHPIKQSESKHKSNAFAHDEFIIVKNMYEKLQCCLFHLLFCFHTYLPSYPPTHPRTSKGMKNAMDQIHL